MISCKGFRDYWGEYECEYDVSFGCDDCIINGGKMSPVSNKPFRGNHAKYQEQARIAAQQPETWTTLKKLRYSWMKR